MAQDNLAPCQHIGFVMDGNGRWAIQKGFSRSKGHEAGAETLFNILEEVHRLGVKWVTVYSFSTENWNRPKKEIGHLLDFNLQLILKRRDELIERGVRIYFVGSKDKRIPRTLAKEMKKTEELSKSNIKANLVVAFSYGGRAEIVEAVKSLLESGISIKDITEDNIAKHLYIPEAPYPDIVVRTSGESRISNFLLWQIAYSELIFCNVLWPDFTVEHLTEVLAEYKRRERRYGGLS